MRSRRQWIPKRTESFSTDGSSRLPACWLSAPQRVFSATATAFLSNRSLRTLEFHAAPFRFIPPSPHSSALQASSSSVTCCIKSLTCFAHSCSCGATVSAATFFSLSFCSKVWHFYVLAVILGFVWPMLGGLTITTLINNWFVEKRGFVTGLAYAGSGISAAIATPIVTAVVAGSGWRAGYRLLGISAAVLLALALLLIRFKPEDMGQTALGADRLVSADGTQPCAVGLTRKEALRTPAFYLMVFAFMGNSFIGMSMSAHANACLTDIGYPSNTVALVMSLIMAVMIGGKIILGIAFDRLGSVRGAFLVGSSVALSALALRFAALSPIMPWVYAALLRVWLFHPHGSAPVFLFREFRNARICPNIQPIHGICQSGKCNRAAVRGLGSRRHRLLQHSLEH